MFSSRSFEQNILWRLSNGVGEVLLSDGSAESVGKQLAEALNVSIMFSFHHNAHERLGAGVTQNNAATFTQCGLGFGQGTRDLRQSIHRRFGTNFYVHDGLWVVLQA